MNDVVDAGVAGAAGMGVGTGVQYPVKPNVILSSQTRFFIILFRTFPKALWGLRSLLGFGVRDNVPLFLPDSGVRGNVPFLLLNRTPLPGMTLYWTWVNNPYYSTWIYVPGRN